MGTGQVPASVPCYALVAPIYFSEGVLPESELMFMNSDMLCVLLDMGTQEAEFAYDIRLRSYLVA